MHQPDENADKTRGGLFQKIIRSFDSVDLARHVATGQVVAGVWRANPEFCRIKFLVRIIHAGGFCLSTQDSALFFEMNRPVGNPLAPVHIMTDVILGNCDTAVAHLFAQRFPRHAAVFTEFRKGAA